MICQLVGTFLGLEEIDFFHDNAFFLENVPSLFRQSRGDHYDKWISGFHRSQAMFDNKSTRQVACLCEQSNIGSIGTHGGSKETVNRDHFSELDHNCTVGCNHIDRSAQWRMIIT